MDRFRFLLAMAAAVSMLIPVGAVLAMKVYTTDTQELPLLATPSSRGRTLLVVPPGSTVDVVRPHSYTKVRYHEPNGKTRLGWIASKSISPWPPNGVITKELGAEIDALKGQLAETENEKAGLAEREQELTDKLTNLNAAYEKLKSGSENYLKLKSEYEFTKTSLENAQEDMQTLIQENENLKMIHNVRWFGAGALVLLSGWIIGRLSSSWRKKRRSSYYF